MNGDESFMRQHGKQLLANGYSILPVAPGTKMPGRCRDGSWMGLEGWQEYCREPVAPGTLSIWENWPGAGVGIACGNVVAIDIDVLDEVIALEVEAVVRRELGDTPLKRVGKAPKALLVYRTTEPFKKHRVGTIEALCNKQHFVAFSIHPDTGKPYNWPGQSPLDVAVADLPVVSEADVARALNAAGGCLPEGISMPRLALVMPGELGAGGARTSALGLTAHPDAIMSALEGLQNPDHSWDEWNRRGMALWRATMGAVWAFEAWHGYSARSGKYSAEETNARWRSYFISMPHSVGAGTIFHLAAEDGWVSPTNLDFHRGYVDLSDVSEETRAMIANMLLKAK